MAAVQNPRPDARVLFKLTAESVIGGPKLVLSGYHPTYDIRDDYWSSVMHEFLDVERVVTGETAAANVVFITPEVYPHSLWVGRKLTVREGNRIVGEATILDIYNPFLKRQTADL